MKHTLRFYACSVWRKKAMLFMILTLIFSHAISQKITVLPYNGSNSAESSPQGGLRFQRQIYLITPVELSHAGLPSGSIISSIGFTLGAAQDSITKGGFKVYLQNTTDTISKTDTAWTYQTVNSNTLHITGLLKGNYEWQVASNCSGTRFDTSSSMFSTEQAGLCNRPTSFFTDSIKPTSAFFRWVSPTSAVTKYYIQYSRIDGNNWLLDSTVNTFYAATNLTSNTYYKWRVQTLCSGVGNLSDISPVDATFYTPQQAASCSDPLNLITGSTTDSTANVFWQTATGAQYYKIQYRRNETEHWVENISPSTDFTFTGLNPGTTYQWRVATNCTNGTGAFFQGANFTTTGIAKCYAPINLSTDSITTSTAKVKWNTVSGATSYLLRYRLKESISWTNAISAMTVVHNDSIRIPNTIGSYDIPFVNGSSFTYNGNGIYVAWEYARPAGRLSTLNSALCNAQSNTLLALTTKNDTSNLAQLNILTGDQHRPETRFGTSAVNDSVEVVALYALGSYATPYNNNSTISALVRNHSLSPHTYPVTLKIRQQGTTVIRDSITQNLNMGADTTQLITFTPANNRPAETDSIIISIPVQPGENVNLNNKAFYIQEVGKYLSGYDDGSTSITSTGTDSMAGLTLIRETMSGCGKINGAHIFLSASAKGHSVYAVVLNSTGTVVAKSDSILIDAGSVNRYHTFYFSSPVLIKNSDYYVGLAQSAAPHGYSPVGVEWENKIVRADAYYHAALDGSSLINSRLPGRFMIKSEILPGADLPIIGGKLSLCSGTTNTLTTARISARFSNSVIAFSSQKGEKDYSAQQALGAPDVFPDSAASSRSWTSSTADLQREFITLSFPGASPINYIDIYENYNAGAVDTVYARNPITGLYDILFSTTAQAASSPSRKNHISFPLTTYNVSEVRIALNSPAVAGFNFIDAVAIGKLDSLTPFSTYLWSTGATTRSLNVNTAGIYTVTVTDGNNCSATASDSVYTPVHSVPIISTNGSLVICAGDSVTLTSSKALGNSWSTGETTRSIVVKSAGSFKVGYDDGTGCGAIYSDSVVVIVNPLPVVQITGNLIICPGGFTTLDAGPGDSAYSWSTGAITRTISVYSAGTYSVTVRNGNNCYGTGSVVTTIGTNPIASISGNTVFCPDSSTVLDAGFGYASYLWSTNSTSRKITVTINDNYTVTVTNTDGCSASATVTTTQYTSPTPVISGAAAFCPSSSTILNAGTGYVSYAWSNNALTQTIPVSITGTYSVVVTDAHGCKGSAVKTVGQYVAPLPVITGTTSFCAGGSTILDAGSGYNIYAWSPGQTTHSIVVTAVGTYSVTVTDNHGCTGSTSATVNANGGPPETPGPISGPAGGVCNSIGNVYSIAPVPNTTRYVWTAPSGSSIVSGQGTTSVRINFGNSFGPGNIVVASANACGQSPSYNPRILTVQGNPDVPGIISGQATGLCGQANKIYSIIAIHGATMYNWSVPAGATIISGQGTLMVTVSFTAGFSTGNMSVSAANACGQSNAAQPRVLMLQGNPNPAGQIAGQAYGVCNQTGSVYSIPVIQEATNYVWTVPPGVTISNGQGTPLVSLNFGPTFTSGNICVTPYSENCNGASSCLFVSNKPAVPSNITGPSSVCSNQHVIYSVTNIIGATSYTWAVPSRAVITSGQGTNTISVTFGNRSGNITVTANNACGNNGPQILQVVMPCTGAPIVFNNGTNTRSTFNPTGTFLLPGANTGLQVYPNPSTGYFQVHLANITGDYKMVITDASNKTVYTRIVQPGEAYIDVDLSNISKGIYFIKAFNGKKTLVSKLVLQ